MSEEGRYNLSARNFRSPHKFTLSPSKMDNPYGGDHTTYFPFTSLPDCLVRNFHFKDAAVYNLAVRFPYVEDVFDEVWRTWYPRRSLAARANGGTRGFFCRALKPSRDCQEVGMQDMVPFHAEIVRTVDKQAESQGSDRSLEDSFRKVLIVLDKQDWEKEGVLVICREENVNEYGLREYEPGSIGNGETEGVLDGGWATFRKGIVEAVKHIISDPERKKAEAPVLQYYMERRLQDGL